MRIWRRREDETWEQWAERNSTNKVALEEYRKADEVTQDATSPNDFCFRHLIECPDCGITHVESARVPFLRCACGFRCGVMIVENGKLVDVTERYNWQYGEGAA
jgi:hypothetical protein